MSAKDDSGRLLRPDQIEAVAALMVTLADPTRIAILEMLRGGERNGLRMADELGVPHKNVSHHLSALVRSGVLARRREGRMILYEIEDWTAPWLIEQASHSLSDD